MKQLLAIGTIIITIGSLILLIFDLAKGNNKAKEVNENNNDLDYDNEQQENNNDWNETRDTKKWLNTLFNVLKDMDYKDACKYMERNKDVTYGVNGYYECLNGEYSVAIILIDSVTQEIELIIRYQGNKFLCTNRI